MLEILGVREILDVAKCSLCGKEFKSGDVATVVQHNVTLYRLSDGDAEYLGTDMGDDTYDMYHELCYRQRDMH